MDLGQVFWDKLVRDECPHRFVYITKVPLVKGHKSEIYPGNVITVGARPIIVDTVWSEVAERLTVKGNSVVETFVLATFKDVER